MNRKLGRKPAHRDHTLRNLLTSLVIFETVNTTTPKAKEVKSLFDRLIARNKKGDLAAIRRINGLLFDSKAAEKVVKELLPRYLKRQSGFVKSYHLKPRLGDNAAMMRLELIDKQVFVSNKPAQKDEKADDKGEVRTTIRKSSKKKVE